MHNVIARVIDSGGKSRLVYASSVDGRTVAKAYAVIETGHVVNGSVIMGDMSYYPPEDRFTVTQYAFEVESGEIVDDSLHLI